MSGRVFHGPLLSAHPDFELTGIVQRKGSEGAEIYPGARVFTTLAEAIRSCEPNLVVVNTPPFLHSSEALEALSNGCHVVVEKPFATDLETCVRLLEKGRESGKIVTAFQNRRWDSDFLSLKKLKEVGLLGDWKYFEAHFDRFRPEVEANSWKENPHPGAGLVWNLGPHLVDQAICLFGMPEWIKATVRKQRSGALVDDFFTMQLGYPELIAELKASYLVPDNQLKYTIHGTAASYGKNGMDIQEAQLKAGISPFDTIYGKEPSDQTGYVTYPDGRVEVLGQETGNYLRFYDALSSAIRLGTPPPVLPEEILNTMKVLLAAYRSSETEQTVFLKD